jgi:hypothetical protein
MVSEFLVHATAEENLECVMRSIRKLYCKREEGAIVQYYEKHDLLFKSVV